jgi:uncharacterized protein YjbI with pentapeptide repeats
LEWLNKVGGKKVNLTGADLSGANLSEVNLTGANLTQANLSEVNLTGANLTKADLSGANLSEVNLTGADLSWAIAVNCIGYPIQVMPPVDTTEAEDPTKDPVNNPPHYGNGGIEAIVYMKDNMDFQMFLGYLEGNTKKYLHRFRYKGKPVEDLKKARWYLDQLITEMEGND